jgi:hypothetical protein
MLCRQTLEVIPMSTLGFRQTAVMLPIALALTLAACGKQAEAPLPAPTPSKPASAPTSVAASAAAATESPDRWIGRWQGPEGTFVEVASESGAYRVTVQNLDGLRRFEARAAPGGGLSFVRDGVTETLRAGNGAATGMKWLADKQDCLVVKAGEGYCRG